MDATGLDRDLLANHLRSKMRTEQLSIRAAARQIGCSAATLGRLVQGSDSPNYPEGANLVKAVNWLGKSLSDFEPGRRPDGSSIADVEAHLRALQDLPSEAVEGLVAMVRAVYDGQRMEKKATTEG